MQEVLEIGQKEMNQPVEIEFAVDLQTPPGSPPIFYLLQIRPIVDSKETIAEKLEEVKLKEFNEKIHGIVSDD